MKEDHLRDNHEAHHIEDYVNRIRDMNFGKQFSKTNLLYEIDREVIIETLYSSQYERRNSMFLLDVDLNLIECNGINFKTYMNQH